MESTRKTYEEVVNEQKSNLERGLSQDDVQARLAEFGENKLAEKKKKLLIVRFLEQFKDFLVIILLIAAIISSVVLKDWAEGIVILVVVMINAVLGVFQESKAEKSLDALKKLSTPNAKVFRDGVSAVIPSSELVPGDIIIIEAGDYIPADARIIEAVNLQVDESALTGESVAVNKTVAPIVKEHISLGDMTNCLFSSTYVTYGRGRAVITETGMNTEIGKIADALMDTDDSLTPLQIKLDQIGKIIGIICIFVCLIVLGMELLSGSIWTDAFMSAIALAVAAIPEGLATVVTVVLAIGVEKMVKQKAIVKKLPAVETLGCASIICSDKTGTLTQNKMTVVKVYNDNLVPLSSDINQAEQQLVELFAICTDAKSEMVDGKLKEIGDPTEIALVVAAQKYTKQPKYAQYKRIADLPFDSERKMMTVILDCNGKYLVITKGAPDIVVDRSLRTDKTLRAIEINEQMASESLRVLGLGIKYLDQLPKELVSEEIEKDLTFVGLVGMIDPARPEVKDSIALATNAGIRTIMITGDHVSTAKAIAKELNILRDGDLALASYELHNMSDEELYANVEKYSVYARVAPEDKVRIVDAWQSKGHVVAMTGDGVNDSPALKKADIGCAMGITGTDVAKEASEVVLVDDNFQTIVKAVRQGRGIYSNIKKVVKYLLSSNIGEVLTIFLVSLIALIFKLDLGVPLLAIHLLWVNLITDTLPAFALGTEEVEENVMEEKPRPKNESFFAHGMGFEIAWQGAMIGLLTIAAYLIGHSIDVAAGDTELRLGHTMAFMTLATAQLFHSFNMKSEGTIFTKKLFQNKYLIGSFVIGIGLQLAICYIEPLAKVFKLVKLDLAHLGICFGLAASTIVIVEISKLIKKLILKKKAK